MRVVLPGLTVLPRSALLALPLAVGLLTPTSALADRRPSLATDAFYIGVRVDPGAALFAAWDLDIYLTRNRAFSVGPGFSAAVLGTGEQVPGRIQDFMLNFDVLRFKLGLNTPGGEFRPFFLVGGGFSYAQLPEQFAPGITVVPTNDRTGATHTAGDQPFPALNEFAATMVLGTGADFWISGPVGMTLLVQSRVHLSGSDRIPDVSLEMALGLRFGI